MAIFKKKFPSKKYNLAFIYVSDDIKWGKDKIASKKGSKNLFFVGNPQDEKGQFDLALLGMVINKMINVTIFGHKQMQKFINFREI